MFSQISLKRGSFDKNPKSMRLLDASTFQNNFYSSKIPWNDFVNSKQLFSVQKTKNAIILERR